MTAIILVIMAVLITFFAVQNATPVSISFLIWQGTASLAIIALLFFLAGVVTGAVMLFWMRMRRLAKKKRLEDEKTSEQRLGLE